MCKEIDTKVEKSVKKMCVMRGVNINTIDMFYELISNILKINKVLFYN